MNENQDGDRCVPTHSLVGRVLRAAREQAGVTQRHLAQAVGRCHSWVYMVEQGKRRIELADFLAWCEACGVEPQQHIAQIVDPGDE